MITDSIPPTLTRLFFYIRGRSCIPVGKRWPVHGPTRSSGEAVLRRCRGSRSGSLVPRSSFQDWIERPLTGIMFSDVSSIYPFPVVESPV